MTRQLLLALTIVATVPTIGEPQAGPPEQAVDIRNFVRQVFIEGIPYQEVVRYDAVTAVPILLDMLADPAEVEYWPNIVVTLGMLGDERAVDRMIQLLVEDAAGPLVRRDYTAKTRVVMSLGYIVNKSGSQKALDFLISGVDPNSWTQRGVRWVSPYHATEMDRNRHLSTLAIIGLGLSGNPVAEKVLLSLRQPGTTSIDRQFLSQVDDVVQEALRAHQTIAKEGLSGYYKRSNR